MPATIPEAKEATMAFIRTFESLSIRWEDGASWSSYDSAAECERIIAGASRKGTIERKTWEARIEPWMSPKPGVGADRPVA